MDKTRTSPQNRSLHLFCSQLAEILNDAGLEMKKVLKPSVDILWTGETVKDYLWRGIQQAYLGKRSTTELSTAEVNKVYELLSRHLGEKFGLDVPEFPHAETEINQ